MTYANGHREHWVIIDGADDMTDEEVIAASLEMNQVMHFEAARINYGRYIAKLTRDPKVDTFAFMLAIDRTRIIGVRLNGISYNEKGREVSYSVIARIKPDISEFLKTANVCS
jgi:hypothetical protein